MPFTISHAIAAAPVWYLTKKKIPVAALVVGCWSPDIPYLFNLAPLGGPGHAPVEILTHCLPQGLIVLAVWWLWLKWPVLELIGMHSSNHDYGSPSFYVLSVVGLLVGASTHVFWDSFSHLTGAFVERSVFLQSTLLWFPNYKWVQYSGGVLGLLGLACWYLLTRQTSQSRVRDVPLACKLFAAAAVSFVVLANARHGIDGFKGFVVQSAVGASSGLVLGVVVYAAVMNGRKKFKGNETGSQRN
jgi:hypothetical protein